MHEAYEVSHLINVTVQIETIAAYDNNILLGTRQGHLLMYSVTPKNSTQTYDIQLLNYCKNFSKKPIQQIEVLAEDKLLLCLTDNVLSTHNLGGVNFPLIKTYEETRGASLFALDLKSTTSITGETNSVAGLCVAVRRKLQLYNGIRGEFKKHMYEFTIPDVPKVISWGKQFLCVGFKSEYTFYDICSTDPKELFPTSSSRSMEPTITKFSETSFLLGRDSTSVLVEEACNDMKKKENNIEIKKTIKWSEPPLAIVWDEPFIIGLLQDQVVVQTVEPAQFIQSLQKLNKARLMYKCKRGLIYVASMGQVWGLRAVDIEKQTQQLLKDKQYQIAIDLTNLSAMAEEEKKQKVHSIQMLHALELFNNREFSRSMQEFAKMGTDPAEVIKLFPELDTRPGEDTKGKLVGKDLENALNALIQYLTQLRAKISPAVMNAMASADSHGGASSQSNAPGDSTNQRIAVQQLELIDTTLLKCYLQTNDAFIAPLLRLNFVRLEESERILSQHGKHSELIILYQTKGQHPRALQLLREQASQPDSGLRGHQRTKAYLAQLGAEHLNLIFKYSDWILKEHPEEGLKIFTEDIINVENLPRPKVLDFLLREHESLVIPYLEHVIHKWNDNNPQFHDALITKYREKITDKKANVTEEELLHTKAKLVAFLQESSAYTPERMILHFPNDSLFEERAIILGKLGRHEQALAIYVLILGDVERALEYCDAVSAQSKDQPSDVCVCLMRLLLSPEQAGALAGPLSAAPRHPRTARADLPAALRVLESRAGNVAPLKALSVLPDSVPLQRLKHFLETALDSQLTLKRRTQLLKGLLYAEHAQVEEQKRYHESKMIVVNDYNVCPVCKKRFGNQSAFVRYPTGDIVHYSCRLDK